jgi:hypothetical protein
VIDAGDLVLTDRDDTAGGIEGDPEQVAQHAVEREHPHAGECRVELAIAGEPVDQRLTGSPTSSWTSASGPPASGSRASATGSNANRPQPHRSTEMRPNPRIT